MTYDLANPLHVEQLKRSVDKLIAGKKKVELIDKSVRTLLQNSYYHVLCRIMAAETGVTEKYAEEEYFKRKANPDIFVKKMEDPLTGEVNDVLGKSSDLNVKEMAIAIDKFRMWAAHQGVNLPKAHLKGKTKNDPRMEFDSDVDKQAFEQAIVETGRLEKFL